MFTSLYAPPRAKPQPLRSTLSHPLPPPTRRKRGGITSSHTFTHARTRTTTPARLQRHLVASDPTGHTSSVALHPSSPSLPARRERTRAARFTNPHTFTHARSRTFPPALPGASLLSLSRAISTALAPTFLVPRVLSLNISLCLRFDIPFVPVYMRALSPSFAGSSALTALLACATYCLYTRARYFALSFLYHCLVPCWSIHSRSSASTYPRCLSR